jgi:hypothetical protein
MTNRILSDSRVQLYDVNESMMRESTGKDGRTLDT